MVSGDLVTELDAREMPSDWQYPKAYLGCAHPWCPDGFRAGNEVFPIELIEPYFSTYSQMLGLNGEQFLALGRVDPSNIAEGQGRDSPKEFSHHLSFAYGSLMEAETQLQIAANLGYIEPAEVDRLLEDAAEIGRMLNGLSRSVRTDN